MDLRTLILPALAVLIMGGCSSFNQDWEQASQVPVLGIEGRWIGGWHSDYNQHEGPLRCLITKKNGNTYHTRFHAKYKLGFLTISYPYDMDMIITQDAKTYSFKGEADLGWLAGGLYKYDGAGSTNNLAINYRSPKDYGTFNLQRPKEAE
jgi:hypothetical protein